MQLERKREELARKGVNVASISYDTPETLKLFSERAAIGYPLLSDPDSKIIRAFGILNETVAKDHAFYGIPHPGQYLLDAEGRVKSKFFEGRYADRFTAGYILVREFGDPSDGPRVETETEHLRVTAWASDAVVHGGNRFVLAADIELKPKMHVYAPGVEGYIPVEWKMEQTSGLSEYPAEYPQSKILHLPAINEKVPVYEGSFRLIRDVAIGQAKEIPHLFDDDGKLVLKGSFRYQACDDKVCYLPKTIELVWKFDFEPHDRERVPDEARRKR